jgi:hypothetical protein
VADHPFSSFPANVYDCTRLEAQILFHPDSDFQSLDGLNGTPDAWTETPLSKVDGVPVECAVSLVVSHTSLHLHRFSFIAPFTRTFTLLRPNLAFTDACSILHRFFIRSIP